MAENVTLNTFSTLQNSSIIATLNSNNSIVETAFADCLSLSGKQPNAMQSNLDMNSQQIVNLPAPSTLNSPVRLTDISTAIGFNAGSFGLLNGINTWTNRNVFQEHIYISDNLTMGTSPPSTVAPQNSLFLQYANSINGTCDNWRTANGFFANSYAVNSPGHSSTFFQLYSNVGGSNQVGGFNNFSSTVFLNQTTGNLTNNFYQAETLVSTAAANDNGTTLTPSGSLFTAAWYANLRGAATHWIENSGVELDIGNDTGSSLKYSYGFKYVLLSEAGNTVAPSIEQVAFAATGGGLPNLGTVSLAYSIGNYSGYSPMATTGTLFGGSPHSGSGNCINSSGSSTVAYGIDLSLFTFTNAAFRSPGFSVNGSGIINSSLTTPASSSAAGVVGSICWDTGFIYVCTATNTWKRAALSTF